MKAGCPSPYLFHPVNSFSLYLHNRYVMLPEPLFCPVASNRQGVSHYLLGELRGATFIQAGHSIATNAAGTPLLHSLRCRPTRYGKLHPIAFDALAGCCDMVLHGESSKRLATPRNTKDKKHLQSTQSAQPTHPTDQAPRSTERTARETHNTN